MVWVIAKTTAVVSTETAYNASSVAKPPVKDVPKPAVDEPVPVDPTDRRSATAADLTTA
jgi:hypothetical protein